MCSGRPARRRKGFGFPIRASLPIAGGAKQIRQDRPRQIAGPVPDELPCGSRSASARSLLLLFPITDVRLPSSSLLAWCCRNHLGLFLLGFFGLSIAFLLTFSHVDLPAVC